jgi:hypothetical protein
MPRDHVGDRLFSLPESSAEFPLTVPDKPGLGLTLNEDVVRKHLGARDRRLRLQHGFCGPGQRRGSDTAEYF